MMLTASDRPHAPPLTAWRTADGINLLVDADGPNWLATDDRGAAILRAVDGERTVAELAAASGWAQPVRALQDVASFLAACARAGLVSRAPETRPTYTGRAAHFGAWRLAELWLHVNDACNLACRHCLVSSGPRGADGLAPERLRGLVDEAVALGATRVFLSGGEPMLRRDAYELLEHVTVRHGLEAVVLTNGTLLSQARHREALARLDRGKVRFQVSVDGATAEAHDALRGAGSFRLAVEGLETLAALGFATSVTAVPSRATLAELPALPAMAKAWGAASFHLMWPHRRGRASERLDILPTPDELLALARATREAAAGAGLPFDNVESLRRRVNGVPGVRHDLGMLGVESLCVGADGLLYPSAATVQVPALALGALEGGRALLEVWQGSALARRLRGLSLLDQPSSRSDALRFLTGGGDLEHAYFWAGDFTADDPWAPVVSALARDELEALGRRGRARIEPSVLARAPLVFHAMGEGGFACGDELPGQVRALHSGCVLAFDVDRPRAMVRDFYAAAAQTPDESLCCPTRPEPSELAHVPAEVVERFYGCGSPVKAAALHAGEVMLDLGSGAGIDVFIAAKHVGSRGRAIGVDMTDEMLRVARESQPKVAAALGYDVVEFAKGFLEQVPVGDASVDCVTSNCVVNLSADKRQVFREIFRVLKPFGRVVLSDIVVDKAVPLWFRVNPHAWGECLSGALTEVELHAELERAGFHGIEALQRSPWRTVEGHVFSSVTVRAYKGSADADAAPLDHLAVYGGPYKSVTDEAGRFFQRDVPVPVSAADAERLARPPYAEAFRVARPDGSLLAIRGTPGAACCQPKAGGGRSA